MEYKIEGYELIHKDIDKRWGRGICTYVNNKLDCKEVKLKTTINENVAIDVKLNYIENTLLVDIYRSGSSFNSKELNDMLKGISNLKYHHSHWRRC